MASELPRILELAQAQRPDPAGWSLALNLEWLERAYFGAGVSRAVQPLPDGRLGGCAAVRRPDPGDPGAVTVVSMLRPGCEDLWAAQLAWIEAQVKGATRVRVDCECLSEAEVRRWAAAGYELVLEELAMERDLTVVGAPVPARWPQGSILVEWGIAAAEAGFEVYEAAFRERPGFPGWSRCEWIDQITGDDDFLPAASLCVLLDGVPAGFVVSRTGWIDQVGVTPACRRLGLASAMVTEATARMTGLGIGVAHLHVNTNNPRALAAWRRLGWRESGRRARFERVVAAHAPVAT